MTIFQTLGALMIVVGSSMEGFRRSYLLHRRYRVLIELAQAFTWMQNEIVKRQTPIIEIIHTQLKRRGDVSLLFGHFNQHLSDRQKLLNEAWKEAVSDYGRSSYLTNEDLDWIARIGDAIQPYDRQSIEKELSFIIDVLRNRHQEARNRALQFGKLYKTLGVLGGVLVVLLLS